MMFDKTEQKAQSLEVIGKIGFSDADNRPFVSLDISSIAGKIIKGNDTVFGMIKALIPEINATREEGEFDVKAALGATNNPVGDPNKSHASVLYSFSFSRDETIKAQQIERAKELLGKEVRFTISTDQFKLITSAVALRDAETTVKTTATYTEAPNLGSTRNTIVTIEMGAEAQAKLRQISRDILDNQEFPGNTDRSGTVQPYHMCVAQAQLAENIFSSALANN